MLTCHAEPAVLPAVAQVRPAYRVALAGQPNMGKSTLFNLLTGLNQHVGNWPGKTVERRAGVVRRAGREIELVDLPGTYSLTANSPEELIAREFILRERPDLIVAVVSAANLERSLYLVAELLCLPAPLVIALNMMDVAEQEGLRVEPRVLQAALGVPVVPLTATRAESVQPLLALVEQTLRGAGEPVALQPRRPDIRADHRQVLEQVAGIIAAWVPAPYPVDWAALKLLEGDADLTRQLQAALPPDRWEALHGLLKAHDDAMLAIASGRYEWIERIVRAAVTRPRLGQIGLTDRLDRWATHPVWGLAILAGILGLIFWLTFTLGSPAQEWMDTRLVAPLASAVDGALAQAPGWLRGLLADGVIGGVGSVLTFLPILVIFFAAFSLLEDVGYMARAAYVMDNFMHWMGLHGKSFLPLFLGFGCNVPAIIGTRVIDSWPARLLTILIAPLVPCTARMAVVAFLAPAFFGPRAALVSWGLVLLPLLVLVLGGVALNRLLFKGERSAFIMEMPLYHLPNARTVGLAVWQRSLSFVKKAGTLILFMSVGVWVLASLPAGDLEHSLLARLGQWLEPAGRLMGMDWRLVVALLTSFPAKENAIATLGVLYGRGVPNAGDQGSLAQMLASAYSPATALAFLTVTMLFIPCTATVAAIRQETGSWKWTWLNLGLMLFTSIAAGAAVFALARALGV